MQIRQRLKINYAVSVTAAFVALLIVSLAMYRVNSAVEASKIADELVGSAFERSTFREDYLRTNSERARIQWFAKHEQIGGLLKAASEKFRDAEDKKTVDRLVKDHQATGNIFSAIVENREESGPAAGSGELSQATEDRLSTQLNMRLYDKILNIRKLHDSARGNLFSALRLAGLGIFSALAIIIATVLTNSWTMGRTITDRVLRLRDGASLIGGGDLSHRIDVKGDDEFAGLSRTFNAMTEKLQRSYQDLEQEVRERKEAEEEIIKLSEDMAARNVELETVNKELEAFIYSVSHDLRAPLRSISGFARIITEDCAGNLDAQGRDYLGRIFRGAAKMSRLIDALLHLSRISRQEVAKTPVDLSALAAVVVSDLRSAHPGRHVDVDIRQGITAFADPRLMELVLSNLLDNAWKFTAKMEGARIEFGAMEDPSPAPPNPPLPSAAGKHLSREGATYYVRDNGVGFDKDYSGKMFLPFHRLHPDSDFEGAGIGLSIVERVISRHGGRVWAEGDPGRGAVVYFTLG